MQQQELMAKLQEVFDGVFLEKIEVRRDLSASDVEEWDSLTHVSLILAVEQAFGIRFRVGEVESTKNVGDLADLITKRVPQRAQ
jgi:acyl carrier protein